MNSLPTITSFLIWFLIYAFIAGGLSVVCSKKLFRNKKKITVWAYKISSLFAIYIILRIFFFDIYRVSGNSMEPTLVDGDYVLVSKMRYGSRLPRSLYEIPWVNLLTYLYPFNLLDHNPSQAYKRLHSKQSLERGDIVIFNIPVYQKQFGIKRCNQIPGDTVSIYNEPVVALIPYYGHTVRISTDSLNVIERRIIIHYGLQPCDSLVLFSHNYYFLTGDNRVNSTDSRVWGVVQDDHIVGKACFIIISKESNGAYRWKRFF